MKILRRRRALSLFEVVCVMGLLAFMLAFLGKGTLGKTGQADPRALAEELTGVVQQLQAEARARHTYLALGIPGTSGPAGGYFILEGVSQARLRKQVDVSRRFARTQLFLGPHPTLANRTMDATETDTANWSLSSWAGGWSGSRLLVFSPSGRVFSSSVPLTGGAFHLLCAAQIDAQGAAVRSVSRPNWVRITPTGSSQLLSTDVDSLLAGLTIQPEGGAALAYTPVTAGVAPASLQVTGVDISPATDPSFLSTGIEALVAEGSYLQLTVKATGGVEPLTCAFSVNQGSLSGSQPLPMKWAKDHYEAVWEWQVPYGFNPGDKFLVQGEVRDAAGNAVPARLGAGGQVALTDRQSLALLSLRTGGYEMYTMRGRGAYEKRVTFDGDILAPMGPFLPGTAPPGSGTVKSHGAVSPDGQRVAWSQDNKLWTIHRDGSGRQALLDGLISDPTWNDFGTELFFTLTTYAATAEGSLSPLYSMAADAGATPKLLHTFKRFPDTGEEFFEGQPFWYNGTLLLSISHNFGSDTQIYEMPPDGVSLPRLLPGLPADGNPYKLVALSRTGKAVFNREWGNSGDDFCIGDIVGSPGSLTVANFVPLTLPAVPAQNPGNPMYLVQRNDLCQFNAAGDTLLLIQGQQVTTFDLGGTVRAASQPFPGPVFASWAR